MKLTKNFARLISGIIFALTIGIGTKNPLLGIVAAIAVLSTLFLQDVAIKSLKGKRLAKKSPKMEVWHVLLDTIPASIPLIFFVFVGNIYLTLAAVALFLIDLHLTVNERYNILYNRAYNIVKKFEQNKAGIVEEEAEEKKKPEASKKKVERMAPVPKNGFFKRLFAFTKKEKYAAVSEVETEVGNLEEKTDEPEKVGASKPAAKEYKPKTLMAFQKAIEGFDKPRLVKYIKLVFPDLTVSASMKAGTLCEKVEDYYLNLNNT